MSADAYWSARQMLDGPVDGFSREAWHDALAELTEAFHVLRTQGLKCIACPACGLQEEHIAEDDDLLTRHLDASEWDCAGCGATCRAVLVVSAFAAPTEGAA